MLSGMPTRITRRTALALLAGGAVTACSPGSGTGPDASETPDPDALTREQVIRDEWSLVALYDAALAAQPNPELSALRDQHAEHAAALGSASPPSASSSAPPAPSRTALAESEASAAKQRAQACEMAADTDLARLLALIAASEAGHAAFLKRAPA